MMRDTYANGGMNVAKGYINGKKVKVLRTGCSTVVVKRSLVQWEQLTGKEETCVLIDGTVRRTPLAVVDRDTPFLKCRRKVVCMEKPLYDVIVSNVSGADTKGGLTTVGTI